jgi:hypothetical protein
MRFYAHEDWWRWVILVWVYFYISVQRTSRLSSAQPQKELKKRSERRERSSSMTRSSNYKFYYGNGAAKAKAAA